MDIQLNGKQDGVETARKLRACGGRQVLIFLTSYTSYAIKGYDVDAIKYLLKPVEYSDVGAVMDKAVTRIVGEFYFYHTRSITRKISYKDILYFQSARHYVDINTEEECLSQKCRLSDIEEKIPSYFVRCHRINIVNTHQITRISGNEITLKTNQVLSISDSYREDVNRVMTREAF